MEKFKISNKNLRGKLYEQFKIWKREFQALKMTSNKWIPQSKKL